MVDCIQTKLPVSAGAVKPAEFQKTMESESDEELDSEDLDESDSGYVLYSVLLLLLFLLFFLEGGLEITR